MSRERVEQVLDGYRLFNEGKLDEALEGFPDDIEWVELDLLPDRGPYRGPEGVRRFWKPGRKPSTSSGSRSWRPTTSTSMWS